jgi:hypothetical protein
MVSSMMVPTAAATDVRFAVGSCEFGALLVA